MILLNKNINSCSDYTLGGVKNIWLANWYDVYPIYSQTNRNMIFTMRDLEWLEFNSEDKFVSFTEEQDLTVPAGRYFKQNVTLYFPKLSEDKRQAIDQIIKSNLICVIEDYNNKYWLVGQSNPLKSSIYVGKTGVVGDSSGYNITLSGVSTYLCREISSSYVDNSITLKTLIIDSPVSELIFDAEYKIIYTSSNYKDVLINS